MHRGMGTIIKNSISKSVLPYSFNLNNLRYCSLFYQSTCLGGVAGAKAKLSLQAIKQARAYSTSRKDGSSYGLALFFLRRQRQRQ